MLLQFTVKNFMSFQEEVTLDMRAINSYKEHEYNLIDLGQKEKYLRVASIYGANASGKSNLITAFASFSTMIRQSMDSESPLKKCYKPYYFRKTNENISFELVFIANNVEYKYGYEFNDKEIVLEWFYSKKLETNRQVVLFERSGDSLNLGSSVRKECSSYANQIPNDTLAISFFTKLKLNTSIFRTVYQEIGKINVVSGDEFDDNDVLIDLLPLEIEKDKVKLLSFLADIDTGITDITFEEEHENTQVYTFHVGADGVRYSLNLAEESAGTLKSLFVYILIQHTIEAGWTVLIDELNAKLHPLLTKYIVDLIHDGKESTAQLIYTTHDTTLLDKKFFRRDQIWFVEKDEYGCSALTSLAEYKIRSDASFEKDYLSGVYGGIAFTHQRKKGNHGKR